MTCFWAGLCGALKDCQLIAPTTSEAELIRFLKSNNATTPEVAWVGPDGAETMTRARLDENYAHVRDWDAETAPDGYLCGACDPFLMLVCDLFRRNVEHDYLGCRFEYRPPGAPTPPLRFGSSAGHFYQR